MPYVFTKSCNRRGASMGRFNYFGSVGILVNGIIYTRSNPEPTKLHMEEVRLICGGYDKGGAYWGLPVNWERLYVAYGKDSEEVIEFFVWAENRKEAKQAVLRLRKNVTFYR